MEGLKRSIGSILSCSFPFLPAYSGHKSGHTLADKKLRKRPAVLRIPESPTSDNLTLQETTMENDRDVGPDGAGLSCPARDHSHQSAHIGSISITYR